MSGISTHAGHSGRVSRAMSALLALMIALLLVAVAGVPAVAAPGDISACSTDAAGTFGNDQSGWWLLLPVMTSVSVDGRYVAFNSSANNLVPGDTNGAQDIFRKDLVTQEIVRCSTNASNGQANGENSIWPAISADGRYVAFQSAAIDLIGPTTAGRSHIYRKDLATGAITRCSLGLPPGTEADNDSAAVSMTPDADYVAFQSEATNLVPNDTNGVRDVFRFHLNTNTTVRCSTNGTGGQATGGDSLFASINANGGFVAFRSQSTDIMPGITPGRWHVYRKDVNTQAIVRCSDSQAGAEANNDSAKPSINGDGRFVAFESIATNLVASDTNGFQDVFRKDLLTGEVTCCSLTSADVQSDGDSSTPSISVEGRFVAFDSVATNLVANDTNGFGDTFRKDILTRDVVRCSTSATGTQSDAASNMPKLSADARYVVFQSWATNLTPGATGGFSNVFRKELEVTYPVWFLAEGTTAWGFSSYITIENPNPTLVNADITYMTTAAVAGPSVVLPPFSQATVDPNVTVPNQDFSTRVVCREGKTITVDRTMTWTGTNANSPEGHNSVGVTSPDTTWFLPEGSSEWGFECWLLIQNPNNVEATCQVTYMIEGAPAQTFEKRVPANSRRTYNMDSDVGRRDSSIRVTSDYPVIPERAMYRHNRREGHDSIGTIRSAVDYYLAEGATAWGFTNYVLVQNPQDTPTQVTIIYMTPTGDRPQTPFTMPPNSRRTIRVNDNPDPVVNNNDVSTLVHGNQKIIAERAMYWGVGEANEACHDSIGMPASHTSFFLPDGQTSDGRETWTLVMNPNAVDVTVNITYMTPTGVGNVTFNENITANSRRTFNMVEKGINGRAAIMVTCTTAGKKIMCERAMYWNSRGAGTDTIGGFSD